jgi:hypothetical protein
VHDATSHCGIGHRPVRALSGWIVAALIVFTGVLGPPATGQSMPALVELRHEVLMVDREFERFAVTRAFPGRTSALMAGDPGAADTRNAVSSTIGTRGGSA